MPPVDVPATKSNSRAMGRAVRFSISASSMAGMIPRMPPPSMERILIMENPRPLAHARGSDKRRTDHGASLLSLAGAITAVRTLPPSPKPSVRLGRAGGVVRDVQLTRKAGKIIQRARGSDVFEQLLRRNFKIKLRQLQTGMLEQAGFCVFPQSLALRIHEPHVQHAPAAVVFQPLREIVIEVVRRDDFDSYVWRPGSITAFGSSALINGKIRDAKQVRLYLHPRLGQKR